MKKGVFVLHNRTCNPLVGQVTSGSAPGCWAMAVQTDKMQVWAKSSRGLALLAYHLHKCTATQPSDHEWINETRPKSDMSSVITQTVPGGAEIGKKRCTQLWMLMLCPVEGRTEADQAFTGLEWGMFG